MEKINVNTATLRSCANKILLYGGTESAASIYTLADTIQSKIDEISEAWISDTSNIAKDYYIDKMTSLLTKTKSNICPNLEAFANNIKKYADEIDRINSVAK